MRPNLVDYNATCAGFTWDDARRGLSGLPGGRGLNIADEAVDRHAAGPNAEREALRFVRADGSTHSLSYAVEVETARLRQDLELDSLDFLRLIETIAQATGVDTPERDYGQVATVKGLVDYVAAHG